jgi:hypothetical protein
MFMSEWELIPLPILIKQVNSKEANIIILKFILIKDSVSILQVISGFINKFMIYLLNMKMQNTDLKYSTFLFIPFQICLYL